MRPDGTSSSSGKWARARRRGKASTDGDGRFGRCDRRRGAWGGKNGGSGALDWLGCSMCLGTFWGKPALSIECRRA